MPVVAGGVTQQISGANLAAFFGGGLPLANGNSIINIATSDGNVTIQSANVGNTWTFGTDGNLTLPGNSKIGSYANGGVDLIAGPGGYAELGSNDELNWMWVDNAGAYVLANNSQQWSFGHNGKITLPFGASLNDTSGDSVAFGQSAGQTSQDRHAVAIGGSAGSLYQGEDSIAIGYQAGNHDQQRGVAIGYQAGTGGTLYRSVSNANGGSGPATTYSDSAPPNSSRLYVASTTDIIVNQRVFGNNIQANTVVTDVISGEDRVDISLPYTAAMSNGDPLTFVGLVIGLDNSTNVTYGMRVTGTDIPANTFVQSTGCSTVTLNQYPTAPLVEPASLQFDIGQGQYATAVGYRAGQTFQGDAAVAVGYEAGGVNQNIATVAVGNFAGYSNQGNNSVAIGSQAGQGTQSANAVAIGGYAGTTTQGVNAVAVGYKAGNFQQQPRAVAIGEDAGFNAQGEDAVAIGQKAGQFNQGLMAIAIGNTAGQIGQQNQAVAIGYGTGLNSQQYAAVAIGANAASYAQGTQAVAIGQLAGSLYQGSQSVAIGYNAGYNYQSGSAVAIGTDAGQNLQGPYAVAIGSEAGRSAFNYSALYQSGSGTEITITPNPSIQIGQRITGDFVPADTYVADIDGASLTLSQAITGTPAVDTNWTAWAQQGTGAVAVGYQAGSEFQGNNAVAIGNAAGYDSQGANSIAIGTFAGQSAQGNNSIILNATGAAINSTGANTFTVAPVRNDVANVGEVMFYNTTSKEITYGNTISVAGNVSTPIVYNNVMTVQGYAFVQMQYSNAVALPVSPYDIGTGSWFYLDPTGGAFESNVTGTLKTVVLGNDGSVSAMGNITGGNLSAVNLVINRISSDDSSFVTIEDGVNVNGAISATGSITGGNVIMPGSGGDITMTGGNITGANTINSNTVYVGPTGDEADGIMVNGTLYTSSFIVTDVGGNDQAQSILHRHSTTQEPLIAGARSNTDNQTDADVTNGMPLLSIIGTGYAGTDYQLFAQIQLQVADTGTISATNSPGKITLQVTQEGNNSDLYTVVTVTGNNVNILDTWDFNANGMVSSSAVPYANLTAVTGGRAFISNGNLVAAGNFGAQVSGGGSNAVPVWSDGSNWYIG